MYAFHGKAFYSFATPTIAGLALVKNDVGSFDPDTQLSVDETNTYSTASTQGIVSITGMVPLNGTTDFVRLWGINVTEGLAPTPSLQAFLLP